MTPERWKQIEDLYHAASAVPSSERAPFLAEACGTDDRLRLEIDALLREPVSDDGIAGWKPVPPLAVLHTNMSGQLLGGYHLQGLLGSGGMGEVYLAHDASLGRDVAIKILPAALASDPDRLARLEREARTLASLNHPNICAIYGVGDADGIRFLVLELVQGHTLAETLASTRRGRGALALDDATTIARQIIDALGAAHERGIVHRDLKPANVKITPDGVVKLLDFGLAKPIGAGIAPGLTQPPVIGEGGAVLGTAAYMSPEQARGLAVDGRTDVWAFGCVLYEMLTGRVTFAGATVSDSIARILEREPDWSALPAETPVPIRRLLLRCLAKDPKQRLRDFGDIRIEIDAVREVVPGVPTVEPRVQRPTAWLPWVALVGLALVVGAREARRSAPAQEAPAAEAPAAETPLANATFSRLTHWAGTEEHAEISPDGRHVAFLADKAGQLDVWVTQLGTGDFNNLTRDLDPLLTPGNLLRSLGFSGDGSEIWFNPVGNPGREKVLIPYTGGTRRPFLETGLSTPSWSPDDTRLAYIGSSQHGDPLSIADRMGADARPIVLAGHDQDAFFAKGLHTHNPVWSPDGKWIYFVHGREAAGEMDVWRVQPSGDGLEQLTHHHAPVNFLAPIDSRTLLYVARAKDWSGPWLWALDVESKVTRRATAGLERHTFVSASRDGRRIVATVSSPTASLWRVPLVDRLVTDRDAQAYPTPSDSAQAPRFGGASLFYLSLSSRGIGDGLWQIRNGLAFEVRKGADGVLSEPPAVSPDGGRVAVVVRQDGKRRLAIMSADGTNSRTLAPTIDLLGVEGQGAADWSPDGSWIVTGGDDGHGPGLFKIPVDGSAPVRLVSGDAVNPVWSPAGDLIVYAAPFGGAGGRNRLLGVRPDGTPVEMPEVQVRRGGAHRFLRSGAALIYLEGPESKDFFLLNLTTKKPRRLTNLSDRGYLNHFDISPDGKFLVFDRSRQNSDVVLIELQKK